MTARAPCKELWQREGCKLTGGLLDHKIVDNGQIGCRKAQPGEHQVNTVHPKGQFVPELAHISELKAGSVGNDERPLAFVNIFEYGQAANTLASPGMEISSRQFREPTNRVVRRPSEIP